MVRTTASPIRRMGTSVRTTAGESSRRRLVSGAGRGNQALLFDHLVRKLLVGKVPLPKSLLEEGIDLTVLLIERYAMHGREYL